MDLGKISKEIFDYFYTGIYKDVFVTKADKIEDMPILNKLSTNTEPEKLEGEEKKKATCDSAFYQYLWEFKDKCNEKYFSLVIKFIVLFRECFNKIKRKSLKEGEEMDSSILLPETLPETCNEFYTDFMENNHFFGISEEETPEIIELIQHFCIWLYKNEYTKSKLSLAA